MAKATSNSPPLSPGYYVVHASAPTFAKVTIENVKLEVGGSRAIDLTLTPLSQTQNVTVTATAPELITDHPDRGNVIESQFVQNTPLNIRNPLQLVNFAQGVTAFSAESGNDDQSQAYTNTFRINGCKLATTESLLDGAANTTFYDYNAVADVPQVDAIQEFKVLTTAYAPEWGRTSGGIVTFATKAGTNQFHGSVFEYLRNSLLDANSYNANAAHTPSPTFRETSSAMHWAARLESRICTTATTGLFSSPPMKVCARVRQDRSWAQSRRRWSAPATFRRPGTPTETRSSSTILEPPSRTPRPQPAPHAIFAPLSPTTRSRVNTSTPPASTFSTNIQCRTGPVRAPARSIITSPTPPLPVPRTPSISG